ncbi:cytochrome d ubiquinol oxidase subunit II [Stackebrandtia nassauensis]|uniref:Cytochrome d ubiquinol oxidase, subunit II n=1 Tax=Stackebrandtia nassauensis (strain DSM 44728 / CIP 108903 / NRRL B-16338 / NBRC 102104 / LLR-40K-21) TaxID=446470 RepID=D3Q9C3_STANL|nr:cytochrome d ubiquinol oxidase subunit II [Stackebrandtia nassauensis]ADD42605.1 cytochrome d ubiquinol oxidase, subunit II [Stackebrandtia nassauensis DSM 44728]
MAELFYVLLGAVFAGYFALAGYDYGVGVLLRLCGRTDTERRLILGALGPFFLGNEVWLVAGLGLLLAAFPLAEGALLTGLYPALFPLIAAIVLFTAAVQIRSRATFARPLWDLLIVGSAALISFGWGASFGLVLQGMPVRFGPLPIITGALTTALFTMHGASLLAVRTPDPIRGRAALIGSRMTFSAVVLVIAAALTAAVNAHAVNQPVIAAIGALALIAVILASQRLRRRNRPGLALIATGTAATLPMIIAAAAMYPYLYVDLDAAHSLTLTQAVAANSSLDFLLATAVPVLPVLLGFQAATWWIWRASPTKPGFY